MATAALFIIEPPTTSVKSLTVKALNIVEDGGQRTGDRARISFSGDAGDDGNILNVPDGPCDDGKYYVAVYADKIISPGAVNLSDLSFEVEYETSGTGAVKGITTSAIATAAGYSIGDPGYKKFNAVAGGSAYTIDKNNWHDYVEIEGRKWATMNVGANAPEEIGDYFVWGTTVKAYSEVNTTSNRFTFVEENPYGDIYKNIWDKNDGYNWKNTPFTQGVYNDTTTTQVFYKYTAEKTDIAYNAEYDGKTILDLEDDAAYVNWGGAWRIPQKEEFNSIVNLAGEWDETSKGIKLQGLFFLAGGAGGYADPYSEPGFPNGLDLIDFEGGGSYLSSSVNVEDPKCIHTFGFDYYGGVIDISINAYSYRYHGKLVRAIVDDPDYMELAD